MDTSPQDTEQRRCPICRSPLHRETASCETCGSIISDKPAEEIRSLNYLLSELARWEAEGIIPPQTVSEVRDRYIRRREELRAALIQNEDLETVAQSSETGFFASRRRDASREADSSQGPKPQRSLFATLADPRTIHLLLFIGAAMLVVGVVIWLRDVLYLKLQDPIVQAWLLAIGTIVVTVSGWLIFLRTRLVLSGKALTLVGSLLVPINFWFLVRSGLIDASGRAWIVCALCTALYAMTARVLRDRLYVYLACVATIATTWALTYSFEHRAFAPYAASMMASALLFLFLATVARAKEEDSQLATHARRSSLWKAPLIHAALAAATLSALSYMPLRLISSGTFDEGFLRLRSSDYDPGSAILHFWFGAYIAWSAGKRFFPQRRALFYSVSLLAVFWIEFLFLDGFGIAGPVKMLVLAASALGAMLAAQTVRGEALPIALRRAGLIVGVVLAAFLYPVLSASAPYPLTHGLILVLLATMYAISGEPRFLEDEGKTSAHALAAFASAALLIIQAIIYLRTGDPSLLTPFVTLGTFGFLLLCASLWNGKRARVHSFRVGLYSIVLALVLICLHNGFDPLGDVETYTTPVALVLLAAAYLATRRGPKEYAADTQLLLWTGSILLCAPLLAHSLQYRLLLDVPAQWRDLATLGASLALLLYGVVCRLRAPVITGATSLGLELLALGVTSVRWLQIPLKVYLITAGSLILLIWGLLEFRHEQIVRVRQRLSESRENVRERLEHLK